MISTSTNLFEALTGELIHTPILFTVREQGGVSFHCGVYTKDKLLY